MEVQVSDNQLKRDLWDLAAEIKQVPTAKIVDEKCKHSATTYQRRFGSWTEARKAAGFPKVGSWKTDIPPYRDEDVLKKLYIEEDLSQEEIGDRFDVAGVTIGKWLNKLGIEKDLTDPRKDPDRLEELYWKEGLTIQEIADELGTYRDVVHRWMVDLDINRRPGTLHDYPWQDEETLRELYWEEGMSQTDIAEKFGTTQGIISNWMDRLDVEKRSHSEYLKRAIGVNRPFFNTTTSGYEVAGCRCGDVTPTVRIHRLVAIADHGYDAVAGKVIHHRNEIPWDNRSTNLVPMTDSEHKRHHATTRGECPPEGF